MAFEAKQGMLGRSSTVQLKAVTAAAAAECLSIRYRIAEYDSSPTKRSWERAFTHHTVEIFETLIVPPRSIHQVEVQTLTEPNVSAHEIPVGEINGPPQLRRWLVDTDSVPARRNAKHQKPLENL